MNWKNKEIDMLHGPLAGKLLLFTLPIALSSMVQQLFNAADTAVAGYFGSEGARRQPCSVPRTNVLGRRECRAQSVFRGRASHGCRRRRHRDRHFHRALGAAGAAAV